MVLRYMIFFKPDGRFVVIAHILFLGFEVWILSCIFWMYLCLFEFFLKVMVFWDTTNMSLLR